MKKQAKSVFYAVLSMLIWTSQTTMANENPKRSIMLWGTKHRLMSYEADNKCAEQNELVVKTLHENPEVIESKLPNFILGVESADPHHSNARILSMDDLVQKIYTGLYVHAGMSLNKLQNLLTTQNDPKLTERYLVELLANFYSFYFTENSHGDVLVEKITNNIIARDRDAPYIQNIKGDIEFITNLNSIPKKSLGAGALQTIKAYAKNGNPVDPGQLKAILDSYLTFSKSIAQEYFNQKIKPNSQKYNITLDYPESPYNGKPAFNVVSPDALFTENHILSVFNEEQKHIQHIALVTWRDHFIAQNIIQGTKKNPKANMLFWFGETHMAGVARKIMLSNQLTLDEKRNITATTQATNPSFACDANKVVTSMIQQPMSDDLEVPSSLSEWYASYGLKDKSHNVIVYNVKGQKMLSQSVKNSIAQGDLIHKITQTLRERNATDGVYFVQVQTQSNQDLSLFKMMLSTL